MIPDVTQLKPGQEISRKLYAWFLKNGDLVPLDQWVRIQAARHGVAVHAGFMASVYPLYRAFGSRDGRYYYLGSVPIKDEGRQGRYYIFRDCGTLPASAFTGAPDAIRWAAKHDIKVWDVEYQDGKMRSFRILYHPWWGKGE